MEVMVCPSGKRTWSDAFKGRVAAETPVPGVTANEVARHHDPRADCIDPGHALPHQNFYLP